MKMPSGRWVGVGVLFAAALVWFNRVELMLYAAELAAYARADVSGAQDDSSHKIHKALFRRSGASQSCPVPPGS